jgi:hypothetical protein
VHAFADDTINDGLVYKVIDRMCAGCAHTHPHPMLAAGTPDRATESPAEQVQRQAVNVIEQQNKMQLLLDQKNHFDLF